MKEQEAVDLNTQHPFLRSVLRMVDAGKPIGSESPFWDTYLIARQRGLVHRVGADGKTIESSDRAEQFRNLLR